MPSDVDHPAVGDSQQPSLQPAESAASRDPKRPIRMQPLTRRQLRERIELDEQTVMRPAGFSRSAAPVPVNAGPASVSPVADASVVTETVTVVPAPVVPSPEVSVVTAPRPVISPEMVATSPNAILPGAAREAVASVESATSRVPAVSLGPTAPPGLAAPFAPAVAPNAPIKGVVRVPPSVPVVRPPIPRAEAVVPQQLPVAPMPVLPAAAPQELASEATALPIAPPAAASAVLTRRSIGSGPGQLQLAELSWGNLAGSNARLERDRAVLPELEEPPPPKKLWRQPAFLVSGGLTVVALVTLGTILIVQAVFRAPDRVENLTLVDLGDNYMLQRDGPNVPYSVVMTGDDPDRPGDVSSMIKGGREVWIPKNGAGVVADSCFIVRSRQAAEDHPFTDDDDELAAQGGQRICVVDATEG